MLKDKAARNLQAGETLAVAGLTDPAATRYYYAMFQAAVHRLATLGWTPGRLSSGAVRWSHTIVQNNVLLIRSRRSDRGLYLELRRMREEADYGDDTADPALLAARVAEVRDFVEAATR